MDPFEHALKKTLRRQKPSGEFTARVMAAAARQTRPQPASRPWLSLFEPRGIVAAALGVAILGGGLIYRHKQQRTEGKAARRQVLVALQIARAKMHLAQAKVQNLSDR
jgi:hypothetical protein